VTTAFHGNPEKSHVVTRGERLNFACPYCGDSIKDNNKKRGNIYFGTYDFHCYNCRTHVSFEDFIKDFGKSIDGKEIVHVRQLRDLNNQSGQQNHYVDNSYFIK
jgi:hypothetical protein